MRKSFIFLLTIFVCALGPTGASAQSEPNTASNTVVSQPSLNTGDALAGSNATALSAPDIVSQISEARRLLSSRQTSASRDLVTVAAFDTETSQTSMFSLPKDAF